MQRRSKTLQVEMVLNDDGSWQQCVSNGEPQSNAGRAGIAKKSRTKSHGVDSLDAFARLLSKRNVELLRLIKAAKPESVAELARLSGRPKASLMLTLRRFSSYGILEFRENGNRRKVPVVLCDRVRLDIAINQ